MPLNGFFCLPLRENCWPSGRKQEWIMNNELRIIISGGGTGGHIFPAVYIANAIKAKRPDAKI